MASTIIYSDLDLRFLPNPVTGDISMSYNEQAVIRSIKNILYTAPYERLFDPTIGSGIPALLFEPVSPLTASSIEDEITRLITNYEPRATIYQLMQTKIVFKSVFLFLLVIIRHRLLSI